jgi:hypothetical protein
MSTKGAGGGSGGGIIGLIGALGSLLELSSGGNSIELPQPHGGYGSSASPGDPDLQLPASFDLSKLPWPPSNADTQLELEEPPAKLDERMYAAAFSSYFQFWVCEMVSALVNIKQTLPEDSKSGKLAYQILNVLNGRLRRASSTSTLFCGP